jgi:hypothetical protein
MNQYILRFEYMGKDGHNDLNDDRSDILIGECFRYGVMCLEKVMGRLLTYYGSCGVVPSVLDFRSEDCFQWDLDHTMAWTLDDYRDDSHNITAIIRWIQKEKIPLDGVGLDKDITRYYDGTMLFYYRGNPISAVLPDGVVGNAIMVLNACVAQYTSIPIIYDVPNAPASSEEVSEDPPMKVELPIPDSGKEELERVDMSKEARNMYPNEARILDGLVHYYKYLCAAKDNETVWQPVKGCPVIKVGLTPLKNEKDKG